MNISKILVNLVMEIKKYLIQSIQSVKTFICLQELMTLVSNAMIWSVNHKWQRAWMDIRLMSLLQKVWLKRNRLKLEKAFEKQYLKNSISLRTQDMRWLEVVSDFRTGTNITEMLFTETDILNQSTRNIERDNLTIV